MKKAQAKKAELKAKKANAQAKRAKAANEKRAQARDEDDDAKEAKDVDVPAKKRKIDQIVDVEDFDWAQRIIIEGLKEITRKVVQATIAAQIHAANH